MSLENLLDRLSVMSSADKIATLKELNRESDCSYLDSCVGNKITVTFNFGQIVGLLDKCSDKYYVLCGASRLVFAQSDVAYVNRRERTNSCVVHINAKIN